MKRLIASCLGVVSALVCLSAATPKSIAYAGELLSNGGFETGDLTSWTESVGAGEGHVVAVSGSTVQACQRIDPNTPRTGNYLFSAGVPDGATPGTPLIVLTQAIDISSYAGRGVIDASGYFSGAPGCTSTSDDLATLVAQLYSDGGTTLLTTVTAGPIDPIVGSWNLLSTGSIDIPDSADTFVLRVEMALDPGFSSIDIGVDDVSAIVTGVPTSVNCPACDADAGRPTTSLGTNYPNPIDPSTTISFSVAEPTRVWLTIYDVDGRLVQVLVDEEMGSGPHVARWDGGNAGGQRVGAGTYFVVLKTQARQLARKLVLVQ